MISKFSLFAYLFLLIPACHSSDVTVPKEKPKPVEAFPLNAVKLLDGPFKHATDLDKQTLLFYEPDRLLARFRREAGLTPKAEAYGGWEGESLAGHTLGHFLSACAMMYQTSGDPQFKDKVDYIVDELAKVQNANGDGYLAAFADGKRIFEEEVAKGNIRSQSFDLNGIWSPFYTHHKVMAGLRDAYRLTGNEQALAIEKRFADWIGKIVLPLSTEDIQEMLNCEFGGIQEALADLFVDSGEEEYLEIAHKFHHDAVINPLRDGQDILPGIHGNTQIPKLIASARLYEIEGDTNQKRTAEFFWDRVVHHHSYVTGGHGNHEYFGAPDQLRNRLSNETTETCNVYNMLKLSRHLFLWEPRVEVADFYERALFNHILSSQHPQTGRVIYNLSLEMGGFKEYQVPEWFTCCIGSGMETHAKYGANIYYHNDRDLYISQFIASEIAWDEKKLKLTQETEFPEQASTSLTFSLETPEELNVYLRYPAWATSGFTVLINGKKQELHSDPGTFICINRIWKDRDKLEILFPFSLHLETMPDDSNRIAILYGPLVLAGDLGPVEDPQANTFEYVPVFISEEFSPVKWLEPVIGEMNTFKTRGIGQPRDVVFKPFYKMHDRRYSVYFDLYSQDQYNAHLAAEREVINRKEVLVAATYDGFQPGDSLEELKHHFTGDKLNIMQDFKGRKARGSERGGWLSFEMKIPDEDSIDLVIEYWGGFTGGKTYDILVDGAQIATENISGKMDGSFLDVFYPLPSAITKGKEKITVRFNPYEGSRSGPFFYARTVGRKKQ